jgi:GxxExxY protein
VRPGGFKESALCRTVIGCAIEVHRHLGVGLLESTYAPCFAYELTQQGLQFHAQVPVPVTYKGIDINCSYRADFIVEGRLLIELKSVERLLPIHDAQVLTYLKLTRAEQALLMNFNVPRLVDGLRSFLGQLAS